MSTQTDATLAAIQSELAAATARASEAYAAHERALSAMVDAGAAPNKTTRDELAVLGQSLAIAAYERDMLRYRLARYRIATSSWSSVTQEDRMMRHPGSRPWSVEQFRTHHNIAA